MRKIEAFDVNGVKIKYNDLVKIVEEQGTGHAWLKVGNTLRVSSWDDRSMGTKPYIVVFLKSKGEGRQCSLGVQDKKLMVIEEAKE